MKPPHQVPGTMAVETPGTRPVHVDEHLLVVDKPPGMGVQPDRAGGESLLHLWEALMPEAKLGMPHRLDRPVSGLVVFTLTTRALQGMNALFRERKVKKTYLAIVEGLVEGSGTLTHRLHHAGGTRKSTVQQVETRNGGKRDPAGMATLKYSVRAQGERYSLLEVVPDGGSFHQIRAQLAAFGHAIKGDVKYGARRGEPDRSIALHAWRLQFSHPVTGENMELQAPVPSRSIWPALWAIVEGLRDKDQ
ncbi:MAG TPA: RluA family pseudouridine synthase [Flavobacteriales bacterium]|nr:RluA family pseudouridine synthase [Flavobacteriales bacterium]